MIGAVGNDTALSAQSKCAGGGAAGDGGCNTIVAEGSEVLIVLENVEGREMAHSWPCWEWLGWQVADGGCQ